MIHANELMIGDWVCTEHDSTPRQIDWIRTGEVGLFWNKVVTPPYLVPIPLTPEILEKNGFEMVSKRDDNAGTMERYFYPRIGYVYRFSNGEWEVDLIGYGRGFSGAAKYRGVIKYVHELQHALRLCGIDKSIEL